MTHRDSNGLIGHLPMVAGPPKGVNKGNRVESMRGSH